MTVRSNGQRPNANTNPRFSVLTFAMGMTWHGSACRYDWTAHFCNLIVFLVVYYVAIFVGNCTLTSSHGGRSLFLLADQDRTYKIAVLCSSIRLATINTRPCTTHRANAGPIYLLNTHNVQHRTHKNT